MDINQPAAQHPLEALIQSLKRMGEQMERISTIAGQLTQLHQQIKELKPGELVTAISSEVEVPIPVELIIESKQKQLKQAETTLNDLKKFVDDALHKIYAHTSPNSQINLPRTRTQLEIPGDPDDALVATGRTPSSRVHADDRASEAGKNAVQRLVHALHPTG